MRDDEMNSGPLYMGKVVFAPRPPFFQDVFNKFPYAPEVKSRAMDADEINRRYETEPKYIVVDKRTHRIRYENETESEVTIVIEPK